MVYNLGKIPDSCSIATIWESPMLENSAWGAGICRAWANSCSKMMKFSQEEYKREEYCMKRISTKSELRPLIDLVNNT